MHSWLWLSLKINVSPDASCARNGCKEPDRRYVDVINAASSLAEGMLRNPAVKAQLQSDGAGPRVAVMAQPGATDIWPYPTRRCADESSSAFGATCQRMSASIGRPRWCRHTACHCHMGNMDDGRHGGASLPHPSSQVREQAVKYCLRRHISASIRHGFACLLLKKVLVVWQGAGLRAGRRAAGRGARGAAGASRAAVAARRRRRCPPARAFLRRSCGCVDGMDLADPALLHHARVLSCLCVQRVHQAPLNDGATEH